MCWKFLFLIVFVNLISCEIIELSTKDNNWWKNSVIYEIFPLSFKDSDGDGSGDFKGITQNLDYLVDIGITAIWLTPFMKSPFKSGGYDVSDYRKVQDVFGTMDDLIELLNSAHAKNLKVIMDFVPNHTSDEHIWFQNSASNVSEYADYYIWKDAKNQKEVLDNNSTPIVPNNWRRIYANGEDNSAWIWHSGRKQFYFTQFIANLPDLNFRNKNVHEEMKNILNYWLELGIDGIRIDALKHIYESDNMKDEPIIDSKYSINYMNMYHIYTADQDEVYDLISEWHQILKELELKYGTERIIMTESYSSMDVLFKYYISGAEIPTNFNLISSSNRMTPKDFEIRIQNWINNMPKGYIYNNVLQNQDTSRIPTVYGSELIDGINALTLFLPGVAIVYYGGEIGMEDIQDQIQHARSPFQWDNTKYAGFTSNDLNEPWIEVHPDYVTRNVQTEYRNPKSYLNFFKSIMKLRQTETLKKGGLTTYTFNNNTVLVLKRFLLRHDNYILVINMDSNTQHVRLLDQMSNLNGQNLTVVLGSENSNLDPGNSISVDSLTLNPGATIIFSAPSSSSQLCVAFKLLLLCTFVNRIIIL